MMDMAPEKMLSRKSLGQHFLVDERVIERIFQTSEVSADETVLEVGPGRGALTDILVSKAREVIAVEADRRLADMLRDRYAGKQCRIIQGDFLDFDLGVVPAPVKLIGNLPYNISTPLILKVLESFQHFSSVYITIQLEFAQRMLAVPRSAGYGYLSCLTRYRSEPEILFRISPRAFRPMPKVQSCFVRLTMRSSPAVPVRDKQAFLRLIRTAFMQRRKSLVNAVQGLYAREETAAALQHAGLPLTCRAEELDLASFARLSDALTTGRKN